MSAIRDLRGRRRVHDLCRYLCSLRPAGVVPFTEACRRIALTRRGKGVMVVLSDFFIKEGYETGLRLLLGRGYDVFLIQVLSPQEVEPTASTRTKMAAPEMAVRSVRLRRSAQHQGSATKRDMMKRAREGAPTLEGLPRFVSCIRLFCGATASPTGETKPERS